VIPVGLISPVVTRVPGQHAEWERTATPSELADLAVEADLAGLHHLTCSQHAVVPVDVAVARGGTYWDPLATLSFLAAFTRSIRLVTNVLVLGYQHPLMLAKQYATLDQLSRGRVVLGVGVGSLQEEFELLDAPFADRGRRADDALHALRGALDVGLPGYVLDPAPVQPHVPFWVGGNSSRSLRRAVDLGDGWMPFGLSLNDIGSMLSGTELPDGFEVVLGPPWPLDPLGDAAKARRALDRLGHAGATIASVSLAAESKSHYIEQIHALKELVVD
jgi:probable F420-dependent oxidoreductase